MTLFRQRSLGEARHQKAARGELRFLIPVGFAVERRGRASRKALYLRIQQALDMVFAKFGELGSARQSLLWMREQQISLPVSARGRRLDSEVKVWALPSYGTVPQHAEQPHLCRCLRLWPNGLTHEHRGRACSCHSAVFESQAALGVDGLDPGPSSWLHHVGRIRAESEDFGGQCQHERANGQGRASTRRCVARGSLSVWPLRAQASTCITPANRECGFVSMPGRR